MYQKSALYYWQCHDAVYTDTVAETALMYHDTLHVTPFYHVACLHLDPTQKTYATTARTPHKDGSLMVIIHDSTEG